MEKEPVWVCEICHKPIEDGADIVGRVRGHMSMSTPVIHEYHFSHKLGCCEDHYKELHGEEE